MGPVDVFREPRDFFELSQLTERPISITPTNPLKNKAFIKEQLCSPPP